MNLLQDLGLLLGMGQLGRQGYCIRPGLPLLGLLVSLGMLAWLLFEQLVSLGMLARLPHWQLLDLGRVLRCCSPLQQRRAG